MYKGRRDPEIGIVVKQALCSEYESKSDHTLWVEIFVPRTVNAPYEWGTIMVKPNQVDFIDDTYNLVRVNNGAAIVNSTKDKDTHAVMDSEKMTPYNIIGHMLAYELNRPKTEADNLFKTFMQSGMTMYSFIMRSKAAAGSAPQANYQTSAPQIPAAPEN